VRHMRENGPSLRLSRHPCALSVFACKNNFPLLTVKVGAVKSQLFLHAQTLLHANKISMG
jgi:hypothetical protein